MGEHEAVWIDSARDWEGGGDGQSHYAGQVHGNVDAYQSAS